MNRITFRLGIALLTFALGVAAVSLWFFLGRDVVEKKIEPVKIEIPVVKEEEQVQGEKPKIKWVYISDPIKWGKDRWTQEASIVVFYENSEWGKFKPSIKDERKAFYIGFAEGYSAEVGHWEEKANGLIVVTVERRRCYLCDVPESQTTMPIIEHWKIKNGTLGENDKSLFSKNEKYRLIREGNVLNSSGVLYAPLRMKTDDSPMGEDY